MSAFNIFKHSRFFLWVNIVGLTIGLTASIMLILFVVNEMSYDKHFKDSDRIVRLLTVIHQEGNTVYYPINLGQAYTELPEKVPGIEAAVPIYNIRKIEIQDQDKNRYSERSFFLTEPDFFKVFKMDFLAGSEETALAAPNDIVITKQQADIIFGNPEAAIGKNVSYDGRDFVVSAVVKELPKNTHFRFDGLLPTKVYGNIYERMQGLEYHVYYKIAENTSVAETRKAIEEAYRPIIEPLGNMIGDPDASGLTEMLSDVYLNSKSEMSLGTTSSMKYIMLLTILAIFILILAVSNFINLYLSQGEKRMQEIGVRKSNGAQIEDIVRMFFGEISAIVLLAFVLGFIGSVICIPYFGELIGKNIDLKQLLSFPFILSILALFILTILLSAIYPAFYLSRFSPLDILNKQVHFSKRRLTSIIVIIQSVISIILLSAILVLYKQTSYLEKLPLGYNPNQVMSMISSAATTESYDALRQELLKYPEIKDVVGSQHVLGSGYSGQAIAPWDNPDKTMPINEYRIMTGFPELMEMELVEGRFWRESDPDSIRMLVLNESAVKMLGGESPVGKTYSYWGESQVIGVVKDFYYDDPVLDIAPLALNRIVDPSVINIRFSENVSRMQASELLNNVIQKFDPGYVPPVQWSIDIYQGKFKEIKTITKTVLIASFLSFFIAMLGLLAVHLYSSLRRTKEISIRRINGAEKHSVFLLLSTDIFVWIGIAVVIAVPIAYYAISKILENFANHTSLNWIVFALAILIQFVLALLTTSGVTWNVLSRNPAETIKSE